MEQLLPAARRQLIEALCLRFPDHDSFRLFVELSLGRNLDRLAARAPLAETVHSVVSRAEAAGWIRELVVTAAGESPHMPFLGRLATSPGPPDVPSSEQNRQFALVMIADHRWAPLAERLRAEPSIADCTLVETVEGWAARPDDIDALLVGDSVARTGPVPQLGRAGVVLLQAGPDAPAPPSRQLLTHVLAERVTMIVVADDPAVNSHRIVNHIAEATARDR